MTNDCTIWLRRHRFMVKNICLGMSPQELSFSLSTRMPILNNIEYLKALYFYIKITLIVINNTSRHT